MKRSRFIGPVVAGALLAWGATAGHADGPVRPNIVFILADDLGYGDLGCYGATAVQTPNIDRLASEGLRFLDAHSPASVCTPTRYGLMTGEYAWRKSGTGILSGLAAAIVPPGQVTLPGVLRRAGYETAAVGKWHLGLGSGSTDYNAPLVPGPLEIGFQSCFGIPATGDRVPCVFFEDRGVANYRAEDPLLVSYSGKVGDEPTGAERPDLLKVQPANTQHAGTIVNGISRIGWMDGGVAARWVDEDISDVLTARATNFIAQQTGGPFFLYFATHDIHVPHAPHARFAGTSLHGIRGDAVQELDAAVGRVLDRLEAQGLATNTLVIFASDNGGILGDGYLDGSAANPGGHAYNGMLRGTKGTLYEGGQRVPFIVRWPGHVPVGVSTALLSLHDMLATLAAVAGQPLPTDAGPDSINVLPALLSASCPSPRRQLVMQNNGSSPLAIRQDAWKYLPGAGQLFDLAADPGEATNVVAQHPELVTDLTAALDGIKATPRNSRLLAWWPLNEGAGASVLDRSGNGCTGECRNGPAWRREGGTAFLAFDGTNQSVSVAGLPSVTNRLTIACWARSRTDAWNAEGCLVSRRPQFVLDPVPGTRRLGVSLFGATGGVHRLECDLQAIPGFDLTQWHHYAARYDAESGDVRLFVDGAAGAQTNLAIGPLGADAGPVVLGADDGVAGRCFAGDLADVRIYDDALTEQRIANAASAMLLDADGDGMLDDWEMRYGLDPFNPADAAQDPDADGADNLAEFRNNTSPVAANTGDGPIGYWRFDEETGAAAGDASGRQHDGVLSNAPAWTAGAGRRFLRFNGSNQFVQVSGLPSLSTQVTAACWARCRLPAWNFAGTLMSRRSQFVLHPWLNSMRCSFIVFKPDNGSVNAEANLASLPGFSITNWHHYAGTYDAANGQVRLYVDGLLRASTNIAPTLLQDDTGVLQMGKDDTFARYLDGDLDEERLYGRALGADEILGLTRGFDDDQDGLPDDFERRLAEAGDADAVRTLEDVRPGDDFDGDGSSNAEEYVAGTDAASAADRFHILGFYDGGIEAGFTVRVAGRAGRLYTLERRPSLFDAWEVVDQAGPLEADGELEIADPEVPGPSGFYGVRVRLP